MTPPSLSDEELDAIDDWANGVIVAFDDPRLVWPVLYHGRTKEGLPGSIAETLQMLVAEVRRLRALSVDVKEQP